MYDFCKEQASPTFLHISPSCHGCSYTTFSYAQSCTDYFLCYHGHPIEMRCTDNLHFNIYTAKCDFPENVQCMLDRPNANKCLPHVTDFFPHSQNCNYFYYCIRGFLTLQQCPFYYGWDIERRACVLIKQAKCFEGSKRTYINK
ncbi:peritrophin-1-like [Rhagoletis pomonella]|uniref:peritrophin-1-like n=1 Tax=Rhagoletis pomonella TaxID=28610 RepID=UPI001780180F|nr:peritrophin-1-like [Rhagoletis pomonella]